MAAVAIDAEGRIDEAIIEVEDVGVVGTRAGSRGPVEAVVTSAEELLSVRVDGAAPHKEKG